MFQRALDQDVVPPAQVLTPQSDEDQDIRVSQATQKDYDLAIMRMNGVQNDEPSRTFVFDIMDIDNDYVPETPPDTPPTVYRENSGSSQASIEPQSSGSYSGAFSPIAATKRPSPPHPQMKVKKLKKQIKKEAN